MSETGDFALSPLDGRYSASVAPLRAFLTEPALMRERCRVEVEHAIALGKTGVFAPLSDAAVARLRALITDFDRDGAYAEIKQLESELKHDVKACEVYLRHKGGLDNPNRIHFGLTSEDVNNLAWSLCVRGYVEQVQVPAWSGLVRTVAAMAKALRDAPFPARTHGQHATPTTFGKELAVVLSRLLRGLQALKAHRFRGKLNGATGTYAAALAAAPGVDWRAYERDLVTGLGFDVNAATTQIEDHGSLCAYLDLVRAQNNVVLDAARDFWLYISYGYVVQRTVAKEVGSSTMPHKINPIRFENAEGNLELSNALLGFLSDKLARSRMQRDLSESTVQRNVGVALGHHHLALSEFGKALGSVDLDREACLRDLEGRYELLSEAIQSVLRTVSGDDAYTEMKALVRGRGFAKEDLERFVAQKALAPELKARLLQMTPAGYVGDSVRIADELVAAALAEVGP
jgi:adenylosuccinate lyase